MLNTTFIALLTRKMLLEVLFFKYVNYGSARYQSV